VIVDEFTGGNAWSRSERRQHRRLKPRKNPGDSPDADFLQHSLIRIIFLLYPRLAGMTGTAKTEEVEFEKTYKLEVTLYPTTAPFTLDRDDQDVQERGAKCAPWPRKRWHPPGDRPALVEPPDVRNQNCSVPFLPEQGIPNNC